MQLYYLVLIFNTNALVLPDKYTYDQCEVGGKTYMNQNYKCIPAAQCIITTTDMNSPYGSVRAKCAY